MSEDERVNILLVDDQPPRLLSYEAILADLGQNLVRATSGFEALELLMKDEFAVILLDVSMPGLDGFETATLVHQHPRFERIPIIFVTALPVSDMDHLRGYSLGAVDFVFVPVVPEILRSKVSVLVELHLKRRELQHLNASLAAANRELKLANSTLQAEKNRELELLNRTLSAANQELAQANRTLQAEMAERERLELVLREADRRKDEFLAMLAHELRNPLAPIMNALQLLRRKRIEDTDVTWCGDVIQRQTDQLTRLVEDLLDVSRITQGKIKLRREIVEVSGVVRRAIEANLPLVEERGHQLDLDLPPLPLHVEGDLARLTQIVGNLVNNAAKYTEDGGRIQVQVEGPVRTGAGGDEVVIHVRDTGTGIPAELLPGVFNLFMQGERALDRNQGGLGVGLALVQRLVTMHGGSVSAQSSSAGSEFQVRLPLAAQPADAPVAQAPDGASRRSPEVERRILVVDDNLDSAQSLAMLLEISGNTVEVARDGLEALEKAARLRPDVVLLDLGLPRLDGNRVAERMRREDWGRDAVLIALTGWGSRPARDATRDAGFDAHLVKPVEFARLLELLENLRARDPGAQRDTDGRTDQEPRSQVSGGSP